MRNHQLHPNHLAYTAGRSTDSLDKNESTLSVLIHIEEAFDNTTFSITMFSLTTGNAPNTVSEWILNMRPIRHYKLALMMLKCVPW